MTKYHIILFLFFLSFRTQGQSIENFKNEFQNVLNKDFSEKELDEMFKKYSDILTPHSNITQFMCGLEGRLIEDYPLEDFKDEILYQKNIHTLFNSKNENHRLFSYLLIASSYDTVFENFLLKRIKTEERKGNIIWAGKALLHLKTNRTTPLFDFLVEHENFGDAHMLPMYFNLNKDSLENTAYLRANSKNIKARILSIQLLSKTGLNHKTENILKKAVQEWDIGTKGYAIFSMKELEMGNLRELLEPLLDSTKTKNIALKALANSPTQADKDFYFALFEQKDSIEKDLLNSLLESKKIDNVRYWLKILHTKNIPNEYYFAAYNQPLLYEDELLEDFQNALLKIESNEILKNLVRAFVGKTDNRSIDIYLKLLNHNDSGVRYWTARSLKGTTSKKIINFIPELLLDKNMRTVELTNLAIENEIDTLQKLFEFILKSESSRDWQRSSIEYLSSFPLERHSKIFVENLKDENAGFSIKRNSALGLARLNHLPSVDLIISEMKKESLASDSNAHTYLLALSQLKTNKAKHAIEFYQDSDEEYIKQLVKEILEEW